MNTPLVQSQWITPPLSFWNDFSTKIYEKSCLSSNNNILKLPLNAKEVFDLTVENCAPNSNGYLRFAVNNRFLEKHEIEGKNLLPQIQDESFEGYDRRIKSILGEDDFTLIIDGFRPNDKFRSWLYKFLFDMTSAVETIVEGHFLSLFYGNYKTTAFGVHTHNSQVECEGGFIIPVQGEKYLHTWTPNYADQHPDLKNSLEYERHLKNTIKLHAVEGGLLYFPSEQWHIGTSSYGNISFPLAIRVSDDLIKEISLILLHEIGSKFSNELNFLEKLKLQIKMRIYNFKIRNHKIADRPFTKLPFVNDTPQKNAEVPPPALHEVGQFFAKSVRAEIIEKVILVYWLRLLSSLGLCPKIQTLDHPSLTLQNCIQLRDHHVLVNKRLPHEILVGAGGHVFEFPPPASTAVEEMLESIRNRKIHNVGELIETAISKTTPTQRRQFDRSYYLSILNHIHSVSVIKLIE